jgi:hydroxymethylglutaryl-CoA reductase
MVTSRIPGFYKLTLDERRRIAAEALGVDVSDLEDALTAGGLDDARADKVIENVIGTYAIPFAVGLNVQMNGRDYLAPMVVEEPSVVAAASNASKIIRAGGGFEAEADPPLMIAQIQLDRVADVEAARRAILAEERALCALADASVASIVDRGGGARSIEVRDLGDGWLVVHALVDCRDAMGANTVNTVAEALADRVAELAGGRVGLRILSNLSDRRCVRVRCAIPASELAFDGYGGDEVRDGIVRASEFAERDPYRAATHNKGIMNGIDPVVIATGNDWRAIEAGAHAYAARNGRYEPLATWRCGDDGALVGQMEVPLALGIVGGTLRVHEGARLGLRIAGVDSAQELAMLAACVGVASNFAALRALATDGIQRGHMALHARSVAIAAGARGGKVELVAKHIHAEGRITVHRAREVLRVLHAHAELETVDSALDAE